MKEYVCPKCGKTMIDSDISTRFRCQFCKEFADGWKEDLHKKIAEAIPNKKRE